MSSVAIELRVLCSFQAVQSLRQGRLYLFPETSGPHHARVGHFLILGLGPLPPRAEMSSQLSGR
jgi:hypothetical protein